MKMFLNIVAGMGNVYNLLLTTIDRFIYIIKPMRYFSIVTNRRTMAAIITVWTIAIPQAVLILAFGENVNQNIACKIGSILTKVGFLLLPVQMVLIMVLIIVPLYGKIGYTSWKLSKSEPDLCHFPAETRAQQRAKLQERKMIKTIGLVLITYFLCYMTTSIYGMMVVMLHEPPYPFGILLGNRIVRVIYQMQSIVNPFLIGWKDKKFRKAYKKLLGCYHPTDSNIYHNDPVPEVRRRAVTTIFSSEM